MLDTVHMDGIVVIGEGEKDEAPMLYNGEQIGDGSPPQVDIAVDPLEGTELCANGLPNALAVIALSERGTMFDPGPVRLHEQDGHLAGPRAPARLRPPLGETLELIAKEKGTSVGDVVVIMLDRPRHADAVKEIREAGARIRFIPHGDVSASLHRGDRRARRSTCCGASAARPRACSPPPRSSASAGRSSAALAAQRRGAPGRARRRLRPRRGARHRRLVSGENVFFSATGVTDGDMLAGVHFQGPEGATTESLVMRSRSGTVRTVHAATTGRSCARSPASASASRSA